MRQLTKCTEWPLSRNSKQNAEPAKLYMGSKFELQELCLIDLCGLYSLPSFYFAYIAHFLAPQHFKRAICI